MAPLLLLCLYGLVFVLGGLDDPGKDRSEPEAVAKVDACDRQWQFLGLVTDCRATIDGRTHRFRHGIGPDDVGHELEMTRVDDYPLAYRPAREHTGVPDWLFAFLTLSFVVGIVLSAVRLAVVTYELRPPRVVSLEGKALRLRLFERIACALLVPVAYSAFFVNGVLSEHKRPADVRPPEATDQARATRCEPDWWYLGAVESCQVMILSTREIVELHHSQFTSADVGGPPKSVAQVRIRRPAKEWQVTPLPIRPGWAEAFVASGIIAAVVLLCTWIGLRLTRKGKAKEAA
ncbi:hypothetical protein GCM10022243_36580 [Saccharothrix violaceirubra]